MAIEVLSPDEFLRYDIHSDCSGFDTSSISVAIELATIKAKAFLDDDSLFYDIVEDDELRFDLKFNESVFFDNEILNEIYTVKIDGEEIDTSSYFSYPHKGSGKPIRRISFSDSATKKIDQLTNFFKKLTVFGSWGNTVVSDKIKFAVFLIAFKLLTREYFYEQGSADGDIRSVGIGPLKIAFHNTTASQRTSDVSGTGDPAADTILNSLKKHLRVRII